MANTNQPPQSIGGFKLAGTGTSKAKRRLVVSIGGLDKSGKTHQALTAPGPIAYANFDTGLEGVSEKFTKAGKLVYPADYRVHIPAGASVQQTAEAANLVWEKLKSDIREALKSVHIRSIVIDTESETWELIRIARFGKLTQVMPHHYGPVNKEYRDLLNEVYDTDKNLILLGKLKDQWENYTDQAGKEKGRKTGLLERAGMKDIAFMVQVNLIARYDPMAEVGNRFSIEIVNCRQNSDIAGLTLPQEMCNFQQIAMLVYPDSNAEDWV